MRRKPLIRKIIFIGSILFFAIVLSWIIYASFNNISTTVISPLIALFGFLLTAIYNYIGIVVDKRGAIDFPTKNFADRKELLKKILYKIKDKTPIIYVSGSPRSGKSEFLRYIAYMIKNINVLNSLGLTEKESSEISRSIGKIYFFDSLIYAESHDNLVRDINKIRLNKKKITLIIIDNFAVYNNPINLTDGISYKKGNFIIICDADECDSCDLIKLTNFKEKDIAELAEKYNYNISQDEISNLFTYTNGNINLCNLILKNYNSMNIIQLNTLKKNMSLADKTYNIIKLLTKNDNLLEIAIVCSFANLCEKNISQTTISKVIGFCLTDEKIYKLVQSGLFSYSNNQIETIDYICYIIRQYNQESSQTHINKLIKHYRNCQNEKLSSILLLATNTLTKEHVKEIDSTLSNHLFTNDTSNLDYILRAGNALSNNFVIDCNNIEVKTLKNKLLEEYAKALIFVGRYKDAQCVLDGLELKNLELQADLFHLLNDYDTAIGLLSGYECIQDSKTKFNIMIKIAHCYKHLGQFKDGRILLENVINNHNATEKTKIKANIHLLAFLILVNDFESLKSKLTIIQESLNYLSEDQLATFYRYSAVLLAENSDYANAISQINKAIKITKNNSSRLLYNCYYIRGEINRRFNKYDIAIKDFLNVEKAALWNSDINLGSMAILSTSFIKTNNSLYVKKLQKMLDSCKCKNMAYNVQLLEQQLQCIAVSKTDKDLQSPIYIIT